MKGSKEGKILVFAYLINILLSSLTLSFRLCLNCRFICLPSCLLLPPNQSSLASPPLLMTAIHLLLQLQQVTPNLPMTLLTAAILIWFVPVLDLPVFSSILASCPIPGRQLGLI